jgi:hypothetical protein
MSLQRSSSYEDELLMLKFLEEDINVLSERARNLRKELSSKSTNSKCSSNEYKVTKKPNSNGPIPKSANRRKNSSALSSGKPSGKKDVKPSAKPSLDYFKNDYLPLGFNIGDLLPDHIKIKDLSHDDVEVSCHSSVDFTSDFLPEGFKISDIPPEHPFWDGIKQRTVIHWKDVISGTQNPIDLDPEDYEYLSRLFRNPNDTQDVLRDALNRSVIYQVIGNGFCGFNALLALAHLYKIFPQSESYSYDFFMEILRNKLIHAGMDRERHNDFDIREVLRFSNEFFCDIDFKDFAVICICLDDQTFRFDSFGLQNIRNTFVIIHKDGHFNAMYFEEKDIEAVYARFSIENTSPVSV